MIIIVPSLPDFFSLEGVIGTDIDFGYRLFNSKMAILDVRVDISAVTKKEYYQMISICGTALHAVSKMSEEIWQCISSMCLGTQFYTAIKQSCQCKEKVNKVRTWFVKILQRNLLQISIKNFLWITTEKSGFSWQNLFKFTNRYNHKYLKKVNIWNKL